MAITVSATCHSWLNVTETNTNPMVDPGNASEDFNQLSVSSVVDAASTPPVTKHTVFQVGTGTIDLTSLPDSAGNAGVIVLSGLKVQKAMFSNPATNANAITIAEGGSNGHPLAGAAWKLILQPGQSWLFENRGVDVGTDVAGADLAWDVTATASQKLDVQILAG